MADDITLAAERVVLGTCLVDPAAIDVATARLSSRDWLDLRHETVFVHLVAAWSGGEPTDPVPLAAQLSEAGALDRTGGLPYLHTLLASAIPAASVGHHVDIVADGSRRRRLGQAAAVLSQAASADSAVTRQRLIDIAMEHVTAIGYGPVSTGWEPVDLGPYLNGEVVQPEPTVGMRRSDGLRLIYPAREHVVFGEMESGKSWFAIASVAAELDAGNHVVYVHFEEPDPGGTVDRLLALGVGKPAIDKLFRFVAPHHPVTALALARLLDPPPVLVVLDGINEAMALHGWGIRDEDGAAKFRRHLVMPCVRVGAATLGCDHVVKDREARGRHALGSIHKGNGITGSLILLENAEPFGRGERGRSHIYVTKDRPGHLRRHGRADAKTPGKTYLGELVVDDTQLRTPDLELMFWAPTETTGAPKPANTVEGARLEVKHEADVHVLEAVDALLAAGHVAGLNTVCAKSPYGKGKTSESLTRLVLTGVLRETRDGNQRVFDRFADRSGGPGGPRVFTPGPPGPVRVDQIDHPDHLDHLDHPNGVKS